MRRNNQKQKRARDDKSLEDELAQVLSQNAWNRKDIHFLKEILPEKIRQANKAQALEEELQKLKETQSQIQIRNGSETPNHDAADSECRINELLKQAEDMKKHLGEEELELRNLRSQLSELHTERNDLKRSEQAKLDKLVDLEREMTEMQERLNEDIGNKDKAILDLRKEGRELEQELFEARDNLLQEIQGRKNQVTQMESRINQLMEQVHERDNSVAISEQKALELQQKLDDQSNLQRSFEAKYEVESQSEREAQLNAETQGLKELLQSQSEREAESEVKSKIEIQRLHEQIESQSGQETKFKTEIQRLHEQIESQSGQETKFKTEIQRLHEQLESQSGQEMKLKTEIQRQQNQLQIQAKSEAKSKKEIESLQELLQSQAKQEAEFKKQIQRANEEAQRLKQQLQAQAGGGERDGEIQKLSQELRDQESLIISLNLKLQKLHQELRDQENLVISLNFEIRAKEVEIEEKNAKIEEKDAEIEEKNAKIEEKDAEIEEKNVIIKKKHTQIREKITEIEEKNAEIKEKAAELEQKNVIIKKKDARILEQITEIEEKNAKIKEKDAEIKEKNAEIKEKDAKTRHNAVELEQKNIEIKQKDAQIRQKIAEIEEKNVAIKEKDAEIDHKTIEIKQKDAKIQEKDAQIQEKNAEITEIHNTGIQAEDVELHQQIDECRRLQEELDESHDKLDALEGQLADSQKLLSELTASWPEHVAQLLDKVEEQRHKIAVLERQVSGQEGKVMNAQETAMEMLKAKEDLKYKFLPQSVIRSELYVALQVGPEEWAREYAVRRLDGNDENLAAFRPYLPRVALTVRLVQYLTDHVLRQPFLRLRGGMDETETDEVDEETSFAAKMTRLYENFLNTDEKAAYTWRSQTLELLSQWRARQEAEEATRRNRQQLIVVESLEEFPFPACEVLARRFIEAADGVWLKPLPVQHAKIQQRQQDLARVIERVAWVSFMLWRQRAQIEITGDTDLKHKGYKYPQDKGNLKAHLSQLVPECLLRDGAQVDMIVQPGIVASWIEDGAERRKVWGEAVALWRNTDGRHDQVVDEDDDSDGTWKEVEDSDEDSDDFPDFDV